MRRRPAIVPGLVIVGAASRRFLSRAAVQSQRNRAASRRSLSGATVQSQRNGAAGRRSYGVANAYRRSVAKLRLLNDNAAVATNFDPYWKWLGIPPQEQPPSHYRLLGVAVFESDEEVIGNAADRQMLHVRTFQSGTHSDLSQRLLNDLATARLTLLDPQKRAAYDARLRAYWGASPAAEAWPPPVAPEPLPAADLPGPASSIFAARSAPYALRRKSQSMLGPVLVAAAAAIAALALLLWVLCEVLDSSMPKPHPAPPSKVVRPKPHPKPQRRSDVPLKNSMRVSPRSAGITLDGRERMSQTIGA
jgi:hypothetical protein